MSNGAVTVMSIPDFHGKYCSIRLIRAGGNCQNKNIPKCLSLSSQMFLETGSRRFRIARTTTNNTAMPMVKKVPVKSAAMGRIDNPIPPSVKKHEEIELNKAVKSFTEKRHMENATEIKYFFIEIRNFQFSVILSTGTAALCSFDR